MHEFVHPLTGRYASRAMKELFSPATRIGLWRRLWLELMRAERDLGVAIPDEAIAQLQACLDPTEAEMHRASEIERETRHDVMAHIRALAEVAPAAGGWLHLGATSCFVTDNADLIILRRASRLLIERAAGVVAALADFAGRHADLACVGHTHFQPAQPTTVGKRACLWLADLLADLERLEAEAGRLLLRGAKGATGTQASFLQLLGSHDKVRELDRRLATAFGFAGTYPITGQTSPRKPEFYLLACLSGLAQSATKFATDVRLLMRLKELDEPAERHPGRLLGHAVQAQPDALRAHLLPGPLPDHPRAQRRVDRRRRSGWSAPSTTRPTAAWCSRRRSSPPTPSSWSGSRWRAGCRSTRR